MEREPVRKVTGKEIVAGGLLAAAGLVVWELTKEPLFAALVVGGPIIIRRVLGIGNEMKEKENIEVKEIFNKRLYP